MAGQTIDFGIDLGTTNSAIARMSEGHAVIVKNDAQSDTTPSCVYYSRSGRCYVGQPAVAKMRMDLATGALDRAQGEFKTRMGTDAVYRFPDLQREFTPEDLSAEVIKALRGYACEREIRAAAVTVPAAFGQNQVEATQHAAELAGLEQVELLPEPLAASLAYAIDRKKSTGHWLVFDMGGGTFDAVLMRMDQGIMKVVDIAGDSRLGGKDMDYLIVDKVIVPELKGQFAISKILADPASNARLRRLLKCLYAEEAKIALSHREQTGIEIADELLQDDKGRTITDVCISLGRERLESLVAPMIDRAIRMSREVCERNNVDPASLSAVLPVGGPTYMPCIRSRLRQDLCPTVDLSVDPMTAVARGAAVYASTVRLHTPSAAPTADPHAVIVMLAYPETTVESEVTVGLRIDPERNAQRTLSGFAAEIVSTDGRWRSGKTPLRDGALAVTVPLVSDRANTFDVSLHDKRANRVPCEPDVFTVLQGIKIDNPPLPLDICVEVTTPEDGAILRPVVRRGDVLPTTGIVRNLKTRTLLRPRHAEDSVCIPVYEGDAFTKPLYNRYVGELRITGDQVESTIPVGSDVTVTMRIDTSRRKMVSAYIECIDLTFDEVMPPLQKSSLDTNELESCIDSARQRLSDLQQMLRHVEFPELLVLTQDLDRAAVHYEIAGIERDGLEAVCDQVKELHKRMDTLCKDKDREIVGGKLNHELDIVARQVQQDGTESQRKELARIQSEVPEIIRSGEKHRMQALLCAARELWWEVVRSQPDFWINTFRGISRTFDGQSWQDETRAQRLIRQGRDILARGYDDSLRQVVSGLWELNRGGSEEPVRMDVLQAR